MSDVIIRIEDLTKNFITDNKEITALSHINLNIRRGIIYGIIGLSGAGKSTLVRMMNLLEKPTEGHIYFNDNDLQKLTNRELRDARKKISMIFQNFNLLEQSSVIKNVMFPLEISNVPKEKAKAKAKELLEVVGLSEKENAYPSQLSGGQKQRVAIARALASSPEVILCDEATSALDPKTTKQILDLLKEINQNMGVTIVIITHQMSVIESICDEVTILHNSVVAESGNVEEIFKEPKSEIGKKLIFSQKGKISKEVEAEGDIVLDDNYKYLRIVFDGETVDKPILSNIILEYKEPISIEFADVRTINNKTIGHMVVGFEKNTKNLENIKKEFEKNNITVKEMN